MIVVINPSGSAGQSFKGLHAYCAHDPDRAETAERVDWIETRNIAANDPDQAWKIMAATAKAQNDIKRAAGIRTGKAPKDGAVLHVVMSFDEDEPTDRATVEAAADEFLARLGVDPARMRSKNKPTRRQFAEEHQVVMYAYRDTENTHVHMMINRIHPETGIVLPSNNDQLKAQKWALDFSTRHGTAAKTPDRAENAEARAKGDYVKAKRRKPRNVFEQEKELRQAASNDNDRSTIILDQQRKKDAALALRGRNMADLHNAARDQLVNAHRHRKASLARELQKKINQAKASTREAYRPKWRELHTEQESEQVTFAELERSFFGRAANAAKLSADLVREQRSGVIARSFRILSNAGARREYFERAQERARSALQREQADKLQTHAEQLKSAQAVKYAENRAVFLEQRQKLDQKQQSDRAQLKADWKERSAERQAIFGKEAAYSVQLAQDRKQARQSPVDDADNEMLSLYRAQFKQSAEQRDKAAEQDNQRDWDIADDD